MRRTMILGVALVAAAACGNDGGSGTPGSAMGGGGPGGPGGGMMVPVVEVAPVMRGTLARSVAVSGVVEPLRTVGVNSQLSGAVLELNVEEGDRVSAGDVLARLDGRELEAQLAAAEAAFQVAEAALERAQRLRERQVITEPEYERDRTAHAAARAQLDQIRTRVGFTRITAPVSGVVVEKSIEAGDVVGNNTRLFSLADISILVVRVGVSELDVVQLAANDEVRVRFDALGAATYTGRIRRIFPTANPETRLVPVEVALERTAGDVVRPGFLARVTFSLDERTDALLVPGSALVAGATSDAVFVVQDGKALRRSVERGLTSEGMVEILSGLDEGETVVTVGNNTLRDGAEVRVVGRGGSPADAPGPEAGTAASGGSR